MRPGTRVVGVQGWISGRVGTVVEGVLYEIDDFNEVAVRWDDYRDYNDTKYCEDFHVVSKTAVIDLEITETKLWKVLA